MNALDWVGIVLAGIGTIGNASLFLSSIVVIAQILDIVDIQTFSFRNTTSGFFYKIVCSRTY